MSAQCTVVGGGQVLEQIPLWRLLQQLKACRKKRRRSRLCCKGNHGGIDFSYKAVQPSSEGQAVLPYQWPYPAHEKSNTILICACGLEENTFLYKACNYICFQSSPNCALLLLFNRTLTPNNSLIKYPPVCMCFNFSGCLTSL